MSKQLVKDQFGANAANYATSPVHAKGASLSRLVELTAPKPDWLCLDVATAAGHTALAFAPHVARVVASDLTPQMIEQARKLAAERGATNLDFAIADAEALPFADATFDLVTCRIAPHHFPSIATFVAEVSRVLKPGGTFGLVDNLAPDRHTTPEFDADQMAVADAEYNAFEKLRDPSHGRALTQTEWTELCRANGLEINALEHLDKIMSFDRWCLNMSVADDKIAELRRTLEQPSPGLAAFLRPRTDGTDIAFTLTEILLVAHKSHG